MSLICTNVFCSIKYSLFKKQKKICNMYSNSSAKIYTNDCAFYYA